MCRTRGSHLADLRLSWVTARGQTAPLQYEPYHGRTLGRSLRKAEALSWEAREGRVTNRVFHCKRFLRIAESDGDLPSRPAEDSLLSHIADVLTGTAADILSRCQKKAILALLLYLLPPTVLLASD